MNISYSYPGMRLGIVVVGYSKFRKVSDRKQIIKADKEKWWRSGMGEWGKRGMGEKEKKRYL